MWWGNYACHPRKKTRFQQPQYRMRRTIATPVWELERDKNKALKPRTLTNEAIQLGFLTIPKMTAFLNKSSGSPKDNITPARSVWYICLVSQCYPLSVLSPNVIPYLSCIPMFIWSISIPRFFWTCGGSGAVAWLELDCAIFSAASVVDLVTERWEISNLQKSKTITRSPLYDSQKHLLWHHKWYFICQVSTELKIVVSNQ